MILSSWVGPLLALGLIGVVIAAVLDINDRIIPNGLAVFVAGNGLALRMISGLAPAGLSLIGAGLVFVVFVFLARHNFIGGGDAKLIAATTLLVPADRIMLLLLGIALAGGLLSCFYLTRHYVSRYFFRKITHRPDRRLMKNLFIRGPNRAKARRSMPYALAILGGATACILPEVLRCFDATSCSL